MLWEVLRFLRLSEDGEDRRAIDRIQRLKWRGNAHSDMEEWYNEALLACKGAEKAGVRERVIVARLRECLEQSTQFHTTLETILEMGRRPGMGEVTWSEIMSVFGDRLLTWRSRNAEAEADAPSGKRPTPAAATGAGGRPPQPPPGPPRATLSRSQLTLERLKNVCRNHVRG